MATLPFTVRRRDPELVGPAAPTPWEIKPLSDFDDQESFRRHVSLALAFLYRGGEDGVAPGDPAGVIRRALSKALVHYYPLAGQLREVEGGKLVVDCTGDEVLFVEADADVRLAELEVVGLRPPFPRMDQLLFDTKGSGSVLNCPLLLIQVTRLLCGGFVLALRHDHVVFDAIGIAQFMNTVAELARGFPEPTVAPAWSRELLKVCSPPTPSFSRPEFHLQPPAAPGDMVVRSFTFGPSHVAEIKKRLPPLLQDTTTTFEALAAFLWRARTAALEIPPGVDALLGIMVSFRGVVQLGLPTGYYGNADLPSIVLADAGALRSGSLGEAVALVRWAKAAVAADYVRSTVVLRARPSLVPANMFFISDLRRVGFHRVDFGWGVPVFGGPANTSFARSFFIGSKDRDGEDVVAGTNDKVASFHCRLLLEYNPLPPNAY